MPKLYTKTGDKGMTCLYDMRKCPKESLYFEALGDLDELSSCIGVVCASSQDEKIVKFLRWVQSKLLDIGSDIATVKNRSFVQELTERDTSRIEEYIDFLDSNSPKLIEFILPGVSLVDAQIHLCRSVTRRAERHLWALKNYTEDKNNSNDETEILPLQTKEETFKFINRLSDMFFALARYVSNGMEIRRSEAVIGIY